MPTPSADQRPAHLVLGAGGVRVVSYVGALVELERAGLRWGSIAACSAGTFVAALLAAGLEAQEIERRVLATDLRRLAGRARPLGMLSMLWPPYARYEEPGAPALFRDMVGGDPRFSELVIPFATAGVDMLANRMLVYSSDTHPDMKVSEALRIAVGIPGLYPAYTPQGRVVVDAAISTQIPVWLATDQEDDWPIVALAPRNPVEPEPPRGFARFITRMIESGIASRDHYLVSQIPRVRLVEPDCGSLEAHDFAAAERTKATLIERGRDAARDLLAHFDDEPDAEPWRVDAQRPPEDRAQARAGRAMAQFHHALSRLTRDRVFISYAHDDRDWLARLRTFLEPHVRYGRLQVWDDTRIEPGERWREHIDEALRSTRVAVLLVTPAFLASRFIAEAELGYFLQASAREGVRLIWVAVKGCAWAATPLEHVQAANDPQRPLETLDEPELNRVLTQVCEQISTAMRA